MASSANIALYWLKEGEGCPKRRNTVLKNRKSGHTIAVRFFMSRQNASHSLREAERDTTGDNPFKGTKGELCVEAMPPVSVQRYKRQPQAWPCVVEAGMNADE